ncbi:MAG TPA: 6-phosphofructokinase [Candidatus Omnitrophota bacterium]|nr:6-phosphofructokinase [Candidatus Omnitrophota bacterium]HPD85240.1 6-phosphofructokinase [Candidatus Omnitrophota bacterium]HRZ04259.1 6-phosphofructokinase [Candidatus Omnitrophota bacterium]
MKNIGIITSGGDCGGLNAVIKGAAQMAHKNGAACFVIPNGYAGLYNLLEFDSLIELKPERVDSVSSNLAGSEAGHSRVKIKKIEDPGKYDRIKQGLKKFNIEGLVISGGDDSGSVMVDLSQQGIKCVHAPKTMDLDLQTYSVGADSTISRIASFAEDIKTTGRTHNRIIVMEVFGRYAGHTAFRGGVAADADAILIPEVPVDFDILYAHTKKRFIRRIEQSDVKAGTYLIIVAEGLKDASGKELTDDSAGIDAFGHKKLAGAAKFVCQELTKRFKADAAIKEFMMKEKMYVKGLYEIPEVRSVTPGHLVRCGHSSAYDVNFGKEAGAGAVLLLMNGMSGVTFVGLSDSKVRYIETAEAIKQRFVDLNVVAFHETLGVCFGRKPGKIQPEFVKVTGRIERHL